MAYTKIRDGIFYSRKHGRIVNHRGYSTSIAWSPQMLDVLRRLFPVTKNSELAEILEVSMSTMIRKARQLSLEKNPEWLAGVWNENRHLAQVSARKKGNPGAFRKGEHANPEGEFRKGQVRPEELQLKIREGLKRHYRLHPTSGHNRAMKAWETRRRKEEEK